jgi:hypothetical protein
MTKAVAYITLIMTYAAVSYPFEMAIARESATEFAAGLAVALGTACVSAGLGLTTPCWRR